MTDVRDEIRNVIGAWLAASASGDLNTLLSLMTEDVLFLTRNGVMRRDDFAKAFGAMVGKVAIEGRPDIQEITVEGDLAVCWNKLEVTIKPQSSDPMKQAGDVLTVFRRGGDGRWRLWRDANLLAPV